VTGIEPDRGDAVHVVLRKEDLDPARLPGKTVVVVDILFATTSIIAALDHGAGAVYPARDAHEARSLAARLQEPSPLLAGEHMFRFIDGFVSPLPQSLCGHVRPGAGVVYATTNGTVALRACEGAGRVLVGSLINAGATVRALHGDDAGSIIILCAGTAGEFNLEDFFGAGCLVDRIAAAQPDKRLTDAALAARELYRANEAGDMLRASMVGRLMHQWGVDHEVGFAARIDRSAVAGELRGERIETLNGPASPAGTRAPRG